MNSRKIQLPIKHALDRIVAALALLAALPVLVAIAVAIKLDDGGPIFFRHERVGLGQQRFRVFKFRTMIMNADRLLNAQGGVSNENRITRVGRFLRRWSLDEIPQLIDVLRGKMSLVGPRPVIPSHIVRYSPAQCRRFDMKPGLTGLAQVSGRNTLKWSRRLELDAQYNERYSLWLDAKILCRTILVVLSTEGMVMDRNPEQVDDLPVVYVPPAESPPRAAA